MQVIEVSQRIRCQGNCDRWRLHKGHFFAVQCSKCEWVIEKSGCCACCGNPKLVKRSLSGMQARELSLYYELANNRGVQALLEHLRKAKTTRQLLAEFNGNYWHSVLLKAETLGLIERRQVKHNGQKAIKNGLTLKGKRFLVFANCYGDATHNDRRRLRRTKRAVKRGYYLQAKSVDWETPNELFYKLNQEFHFTLDVSASAENTKCLKFFTKEQDGLRQAWFGQVWCNPPHGSQIPIWINKSLKELQAGHCNTVVMLLPAKTDTKWYHELVKDRGEVRFLPGRLKFNNSKNSAPFGSMIVIYRNLCREQLDMNCNLCF